MEYLQILIQEIQLQLVCFQDRIACFQITLRCVSSITPSHGFIFCISKLCLQRLSQNKHIKRLSTSIKTFASCRHRLQDVMRNLVWPEVCVHALLVLRPLLLVSNLRALVQAQPTWMLHVQRCIFVHRVAKKITSASVSSFSAFNAALENWETFSAASDVPCCAYFSICSIFCNAIFPAAASASSLQSWMCLITFAMRSC